MPERPGRQGPGNLHETFMMMRYTILVMTCCLLFSCSDSFIKHKLAFEKNGDCAGEVKPVKMISNINGERYEFNACMNDDFNGKDYTVERTGDSLIIRFPKTPQKKQSNFNLVLDIDAKPRYGHIILDGKEITVVPYQ